MTKLILENEYGTYSVEVKENDLTTDRLLELFVSVLKSAEYQTGSIENSILDKSNEINEK